MPTETFSLSKPLKTHNGEVTTLALREPTAGAFIDYGEPFKVVPRKGADGEPDGIDIDYHNNKAFLRFLVDMIEEKVDELIIRGITGSDFQRLRGAATNIILLGVGDKNPT